LRSGGASRANGTGSARIALLASGTSSALAVERIDFAILIYIFIGVRFTVAVLIPATNAGGASVALLTGRAGRTLRAGGASGAGFTLLAGRANRTGGASRTCIALIAFGARDRFGRRLCRKRDIANANGVHGDILNIGAARILETQANWYGDRQLLIGKIGDVERASAKIMRRTHATKTRNVGKDAPRAHCIEQRGRASRNIWDGGRCRCGDDLFGQSFFCCGIVIAGRIGAVDQTPNSQLHGIGVALHQSLI
jgi:hypothetical protein